MSAFSELSSFQALLNYSFIIGLFGISLAFFGKKFTVSLIPALTFLIFAVPLPKAIFSDLSIQMQLISSTIGTNIIQFLGFSVFQDGNIIDLGHMKLQVIEACSGLSYLFPLMSLGFLMVCFIKDKWWKRLIIFVSVVPITVFMNSIRIAIVGITVNIWGQKMAEGVLHIFEGFIIFGICLILLMLEVWLFLHFSVHGRFRDEYIGLPKGSALSENPKIAPIIAASTLLCVCALALFNSNITKNALENTPVTINFSSFPVKIKNWHGKRNFLNPAELELLNLSDYWIANYSNEYTNIPVNLYIAYYASQHMYSSIHMPLNCIVGNGWEVLKKSKVTINLTQKSIPVVRMIVSKGNEKVLVYYWLEQRGRQFNDITKAKIFLALDSIIMHRTDGALVRLTTPIVAGETPEKADDRIKIFLNSAYSYIANYILGKDIIK